MAVGKEFIVTVTEAVFVHVPSETVTVYVPPIASVALVETVGFCRVLEKVFGPDHEYELPVPPPLSVKVLPIQTGLLLEAVADGAVITVTVTLSVPEHPADVDTVTV